MTDEHDIDEFFRHAEADGEFICEHAGHAWEPAGGGLEICLVCHEDRWADDTSEPDMYG